ncbi:MAG: GGDEF domain-containing protein [Lachnospiraceae bacterium]|nr:GGDEF domain-containing protein [Lachnospiraceae bacterium]
MKKKKRITHRTFVLTAVTGGILIMVVLAISILWSYKRTNNATDEAVSAVSEFYLEAMADRRARTITNLINNSFEQMDKAMAFIRDEDIMTQDDLRLAIGKVKSLLSLNRFAVVDTDNIVYTQYTTYTGGSRHAFLAEEKMEERYISTVLKYGSSMELCLAAPSRDIRLMDKDIKACFVQIDINEIVDLLAFDDQGRTYFGLYTPNGENLSGTELGPYIAGTNIFEAIKGVVPIEEWDQNRNNFSRGLEGCITFTADGNEATLVYVPVEGTDWQMVVLISGSVIHETIHDISENSIRTSRNMVLYILVLMLLFAVILLVELGLLAKYKLEDEKEKSSSFHTMANTDSMTGVRNKHAFSAYEAEVNEKIKNSGISDLAVIVCDVNGLKLINDTQGHAAGDKLIKDASMLICEYFTHGMVFRIGGDEFAVILREKGYDTMEETIATFNSRVEENIRTKDVVISIGCSTLKPEDEQLHDVFERADHLMYIRKKELKGMGAPTRE